MNILFSFFLNLLFFSTLSAQINASFQKGNESDNIQPIEFANVYFTSEKDSYKIITGTITDSLGYFVLENILFGNYILHVHLLGYLKKKYQYSFR